MKNDLSLLCFLVMVIFTSCHSTSPKGVATVPQGYRINGKIRDINSGWVFMKHADESGNAVVDSAEIKNHRFVLNGEKSTAEQVTLFLKKKGASVKFFLEDGDIKIVASADSFYNAKITGSASQDTYQDYLDRISPIEMKIETLNKALSDATPVDNAISQTSMGDSLRHKLAELDSLKSSTIAKFISDNPSSVVTARLIVSNFLWNPDAEQLNSMFYSLDPTVQRSQYGKIIKEHLDIAKRLAIGSTAPDFSQPDMEGNLFTLSSLRGKFVLVNFWASWCGPCRKDNPHLVKAYQQFKNKGFTIIGVSLDHNKQAWINAVKKDHLDWTQVSDLQGLSNKAMQDYGVWATPTCYLLDKEGTIIGRNLFGEKLEEKLSELLP